MKVFICQYIYYLFNYLVKVSRIFLLGGIEYVVKNENM